MMSKGRQDPLRFRIFKGLGNFHTRYRNLKVLWIEIQKENIIHISVKDSCNQIERIEDVPRPSYENTTGQQKKEIIPSTVRATFPSPFKVVCNSFS